MSFHLFSTIAGRGMALTEWELWACAQKMIRQHPRDARDQAANKAEQMLGRGDAEGAHHWRLIGQRIDRLLETGPSGVH